MLPLPHHAVLGDAMTDTAEIRRHLAAMTPGEWEASDSHGLCIHVGQAMIADMEENSNHADAAGSVYLHNNAEEMANEIDALRAAMKRLREVLRVNYGHTLRTFADAAGVSPTQMSEWTSDPIATPPDLVD